MGTGYHGGFGATKGSAYKKSSSSKHNQCVTISLKREDIIDALMGVTLASTVVAEFIRDKKIGINILGDKLFDATLRKDVDPKKTNAYQDKNQIYIRRSALKGYTNFVHEGTHAYDYIKGVIKPASFEGELRAYMNEHEYQIKKGEHVEYEGEDEIRVHIKLEYGY